MRHRISYVHTEKHERPVKSANASYVEIEPTLFPAREDKFTLSTDRLTHVSAVRIQISRPHKTGDTGAKNATNNGGNTQKNTLPFSYSHQVGVHVYAVPIGMAGPNEESEFYAQLNTVLERVLGFSVRPENCILSLNSFYYHTSADVEARFPDIPHFPSDWVALDYYYSDGTVTVSTFDPQSSAVVVNAENSDTYTEVGVFELLDQSSRDDLILSGARVIMNDSDDDTVSEKPKENPENPKSSSVLHKTMFHVKPRHRHLDSISSFSLVQNGLHPVIAMGDVPAPPVDDDIVNCQLFSYLTLEKSVFLDPYQVPDSVHIVTNYGTRNLELPEYSVPQWGNEILMEVHESPLEITLHSRYQLPSDSHTHTNVRLEKPVLFYACDVTNDVFLLKNSPFDTKKPIGGTFEKFFTEDTVFYHFSERGAEEVSIPNASGDASTVNLVTFSALMLGIFFILLKSYQKFRSPDVPVAKKNE